MLIMMDVSNRMKPLQRWEENTQLKIEMAGKDQKWILPNKLLFFFSLA